MKRYALIRRTVPSEVEAYLPSNYHVIHHYWEHSDDGPDGESSHDDRYSTHMVVIGGEDVAGWTLDEYVLPRLASGLIFGREIDLSHPVMKEIPA